jgi:circadian clock protein KaiC
LLRGTVALLMGPAGAGKSIVSLQFAIAAAARGERSIIYVFDEGVATLRGAADALGLGVTPHLDSGMMTIRQIDAAELTPGQFVHAVRHAVEHDDARLVIIDSLNGYINAMPEEQFLGAHLHEMSAYLRQRGVVVLLTMAQHGIVGSMSSVADVSYLADSIVLFRFFEFSGAIRRAISMPKKRASAHEQTIRELLIGPAGVQIGDRLDEFQGVLTGVPTYVGDERSAGRPRES